MGSRKFAVLIRLEIIPTRSPSAVPLAPAELQKTEITIAHQTTETGVAQAYSAAQILGKLQEMIAAQHPVTQRVTAVELMQVQMQELTPVQMRVRIVAQLQEQQVETQGGQTAAGQVQSHVAHLVHPHAEVPRLPHHGLLPVHLHAPVQLAHRRGTIRHRLPVHLKAEAARTVCEEWFARAVTLGTPCAHRAVKRSATSLPIRTEPPALHVRWSKCRMSHPYARQAPIHQAEIIQQAPQEAEAQDHHDQAVQG